MLLRFNSFANIISAYSKKFQFSYRSNIMRSQFFTPVNCYETKSNNKFNYATRLIGIEKNVWVEFIQLAIENEPLNLGQGFPDFAPPKEFTDALSEVSKSNNVFLHQYTRGYGHMRLVNILSRLYSSMVSQSIDPNTEILVTNGAYEALYCAILGNINPGDEVIIFEPFFDCYEPMVKLAHGIPIFVPLNPIDSKNFGVSMNWSFDEKALESAFNEHTKALILNNPNNPLGKVFTRNELNIIAALAKKWNVVVISDEVYEWLVYPPQQHIRIASLPDMWERTVTIGSAGKTFSLTGWKLGWAYGPKVLLRNLQLMHQHCLYCCATPIQEAVAINLEKQFDIFEKNECYMKSLALELLSKRDFLAEILRDVGFIPIIPDGGYFMMADWNEIGNNLPICTPLNEQSDSKDYKFVKWLSRTWKLQCIPCSAFYSSSHKYLGDNYIRFCFIKKHETLKEAQNIMIKIKESVC